MTSAPQLDNAEDDAEANAHRPGPGGLVPGQRTARPHRASHPAPTAVGGHPERETPANGPPAGSTPPTGRPAGPGGEYTVDEVARLVGMSPRNIRAHQARRLLPPPARRGRTAIYDDSHIQRLESIKALQRKGFNLVSIEAILGPRGTSPAAQALVQVMERLAEAEPAVVYTLSRYNIVRRDETGAMHICHPRLLHTAFEMRKMGLSLTAAATLLAEMLERIRSVTEGLVLNCSSRALSMKRSDSDAAPASWEELDMETAGLADSTVNLLHEAFRVVAGNSAKAVAADLITDRVGPDLKMDVTRDLDSG